MSIFPLKCFDVKFSDDFSELSIINRISGAQVKCVSIVDCPGEVVINASSDSINILENPDGLPGPVVSAPPIDLSQQAAFEINTFFYGGVGTSDLRDLRVSNIFDLRNGRITFERKGSTMYMVGKEKDPSKPFYYQLQRVRPNSPTSRCQDVPQVIIDWNPLG